MRNFSYKIVEKFKTHILYPFLFFEYRAVYEIMWEHFVEWGRPHITRRMRIVF